MVAPARARHVSCAARMQGVVRPVRAWSRACLALLLAAYAIASMHAAHAEDGHDLWLRDAPLDAGQVERVRGQVTGLVASRGGPTLGVAGDELTRTLGALLGRPLPLVDAPTADGAIVLGTPRSSPLVAGLDLDLDALGDEGFVIRSVSLGGRRATVIAARAEIGLLYGAFHFLRLVRTAQPLAALDVRERPRVRLRVLDHWDNLDGYVERGYAGASLWDWDTLPEYRDPRYTAYARANASLGINGAVLNNVNASPLILRADYLRKTAAIADAFRPYGVRVYLSARFDAPIALGGLPTADPLDAGVQRWWRGKADEIHALIPDFGGFLVKANSEGQPGPQDYGRSHADGANLLADALAPHGGVVMWRAFVYAHTQPDDRAKQAYAEFVPLDGRFRDNVLLQVKNGPIDFQPREPFHPLFGAMPRTPLMMEFQITKEYLGFATHLVYLGSLYEETLRADTHARGRGATVASVIDGSLDGHALSGIAGVANIGTDRNWSGSHFDQANWYAFGRLAWNPRLTARGVADEWARMTFSNDRRFVAPVVDMMMASRQAAVDYMTPLGLHHVMARGHHYGPGPWVSGGPRADWTSVYYHRADRDGIGFDRTARGSNAVAQYAPPVARGFGDLTRVPDDLLLWFHRVPWDHRMRSGRPLWDEMVVRYDRGVAQVGAMGATWAAMAPHVDAERHGQVAAFLRIQAREARWWRDASIAYFQSVAGRALPTGTVPPERTLAEYEALEHPFAPGDGR